METESTSPDSQYRVHILTQDKLVWRPIRVLPKQKLNTRDYRIWTRMCSTDMIIFILCITFSGNKGYNTFTKSQEKSSKISVVKDTKLTCHSKQHFYSPLEQGRKNMKILLDK